MYCKKCGAQNQDGEKFCIQCGANIMQKPAPASTSTEAVPTQTPKQKKKLPKWALIAIPVAVILLIILIVCLIINGNTVKMDKQYIDFEVEGYNGYGSAYAEIDWGKVSEKYGSKLKKAFKGGGQLGDMLNPVAVMSMFVDVELDYEGVLKNGDSVKYKWVVNEKLYDLFDIKFNFKNGTYKVTGLEEIESVNIFDKITVTFNGYDGVGSVSARSDGYGDVLYYYMDFDKTSDLKNGDVITLTLSEDGVDYFIDEYGKAPLFVSMSYMVEGLIEPTSYNPFDYFELDLSGMNGFTTAAVRYTGGYLDEDEFTISKYENLSNGDVVTITISESVCKEYLESDGVIFTETSKEFTVSGRGALVKKLSQMSSENWSELKEIAEHNIEYCEENYWNSGATLKTFEYVGAHLLTSKSEEDSYITLVYEVTVDLRFEGYNGRTPAVFEDTVEFFWVINFEKVTTNSEGQLEYSSCYYLNTSESFDSGKISIYPYDYVWSEYTWKFNSSYETYSEFYEDYVEYNASNYNNEDNID